MSIYPELSEPTITNDLYVSIIGSNKNKLKLQNVIMRIIEINNNVLTLEFLPESNDNYNKLLEITNYYRNELVNNSTKWFGSSMNEIRLHNMFCSSIELPKSIPGYPTLKMCVTDKTKFIGSGRKKISLESLELGMYIDITLIVNSVMYYPDKCYLEYQMERIKFVKSE